MGLARATQARLLGRWATAAVWVAAPAVPLLLISGGLFEGTAEDVGFVGLLGAFSVAWVVIGRSLLRIDTPRHL